MSKKHTDVEKDLIEFLEDAYSDCEHYALKTLVKKEDFLSFLELLKGSNLDIIIMPDTEEYATDATDTTITEDESESPTFH